MTKPQPHTTKQPVENKPLNASRYTGFYLTLLILSTVGTTFAFLGLIGLPDIIRQFSLSVPYAALSLFNIAVILPVSILALVLLWLKKPLGIWLKLGTYAASILVTIGLLLTVQPILDDITKEAIAELEKSSQTVSTSLIETVTALGLYIGLGMAIVISVVFALLWWFAWKKQVEADSE